MLKQTLNCIHKLGTLALIAGVATCLLSSNVSAQDKQINVGVEGGPSIAAKKAYDVIKFEDVYDLTKPELQETGLPEDKAADKEKRNAKKVVRDRIKGIEKNIKSALTGSGNLGAVPNFRRFMQGFVLAAMTQTDDLSLSKLGEFREDFIDDYLGDKVRGTARQTVIQEALPTLQRVAEGNYHPAVRHNAVITLGLIDNTALNRSAATLPSPNTEAYNFLSNIFTSGQSEPYLKIAAMAGVDRHLAIDRLRTNSRIANLNALQREALAIVQGGGAGSENWPDAAKYWMKRRSVQLLGNIGRPGDNGVVVDELLKIAGDNDASKNLKMDAVTALGKLNYAGIDNARAKTIFDNVVAYAAESVSAEADFIDFELQELIRINILYADVDLEKVGNADENTGRSGRGSGIGAGGGSSGLDGGPSQPQKKKPKIDLGPQVEIATYHLNAARTRVKTSVNAAKQAVSAKSLASRLDKSAVDQAVELFDEVLTDADAGIVNLDELDEEDDELDEEDPDYEKKYREKNETRTQKMIRAFTISAQRIRNAFGIQGNAQPGAAGGDQAVDF